jgi:hypothetical protein
VGALRSRNGERAGTELVGEHPVQVAFAVAESSGEASHSFALDDTVGDEPHGAGDHVVARVPVRGAR